MVWANKGKMHKIRATYTYTM